MTTRAAMPMVASDRAADGDVGEDHLSLRLDRGTSALQALALEVKALGLLQFLRASVVPAEASR